MAKVAVHQFDGGIAPNSKSGFVGSCRFSTHLDIFSDSDSLSQLPGATKDSSTVVVGLVKHFVDALPWVTDKYGYDDAGNIYKRTSGGTWTVDRAVAVGGAAGQGLITFENSLYYATSTALGRKRYLSGTPAYNDDFLSNGVEDLDLSQTLSGQTYTVPTSITESAANEVSITPTKDPLKAIIVTLTSKGTGNMTLTLHDADDNSLGTVTIANASLAVGANTFTFATPIRINIGTTYHFHLTSTVGDGTATTGTTANFSTVTYKTLFGILIADTEYHPMILHNDGTSGIIVIGNEHYLATYDGISYNPNRIVIEPGFKVRGVFKVEDWVVAYCWKGSAIGDSEIGRLYYWDGISTYWDFYEDVTGGMPNALANLKNRIFSILGTRGELNLGTKPFYAIMDAPKLTKGKKIEVLPGAIALWSKRVHFGYSNTDDSATTGIQQGIYEYGSDSDLAIGNNQTREVLNMAYSPSTAIANRTSFKIGMVNGFGSELFFSIKDGSSYWVDKVSKGGNPAATFSWESLILDQSADKKGNPYPAPEKEKLGIKLVITFLPLPTDCTITPKYKLERATNWTSGTAAVATATRAEVLVGGLGGLRYKEVEVGFDGANTGTGFPTITGVYWEFEPLEDERTDN